MTLLRLAIGLVGLLLVAAPVDARPLRYLLDAQESTVNFTVTMGQSPLKGRMPVAHADLTLDFDHPSASRAKVTLDVAHAEMGLPFALTALQSPEVLDSAQFPLIAFESVRVRSTGDMARIDGQITIRGVTRPVALMAEIFRPAGSKPTERDRLTIHLTGTVHRSDFGAKGYGDLVGDDILIDISAHLQRIGRG